MGVGALVLSQRVHMPSPLSRLSCPTSVELGQPITYFLASNGHAVGGLGPPTPKAKCYHLPVPV